MFTKADANFIGICLEGFFFGVYSGIFAMYLRCASKNSRTSIMLFYALCLLYILSTVDFVSDALTLILASRIRALSLQHQVGSKHILFRLFTIQTIASGCCDFIAQCIIIYRCWIVWDQKIRVVIIPSFLAIAYLATWLAPVGSQGKFFIATWENTSILTSLVASMAVNTLVTGLIVFRILKVFLFERTLGSTRGTTLRHVIFVIIESGMMLFAIQLVRVVLGNLQLAVPNTKNLAVGINQMFNGITPTIILVRVSMRLSFEDKESFKEAVGSLCFNNSPSDPNTLQTSANEK